MELGAQDKQQHVQALDVIDRLKAVGSLRQVELPQLVVSGDQSAGKSSVLNAICGLQFPVSEGVCTRFPTEFSLRPAPMWQLTATIRASSDRSAEEVTALQNFRVETAAYEKLHKDISKSFVDAIEEAGQVMGIGVDARNFAQDVLCIKLIGPTPRPLTLIDLPGLFHAEDENQTLDDAGRVRSLTLDYMRQKRTINLPVISANNNLSNQEVTALVAQVDPTHERSLGIVTKVDTISSRGEIQTCVKLLSNHTKPYKLGWHALMNRGQDKQTTTQEERDQAEVDFLKQGSWAAVPVGDKGINSLMNKLGIILHNAIILALPDVLEECEILMSTVRDRLQDLDTRSKGADQDCEELFDVGQRFCTRLSNVMKGDYDEIELADIPNSQYHDQELRSIVEGLLKQLETDLKSEGHTWVILEAMSTQITTKDTRAISHKDLISRVLQIKLEKNLRGTPGQLDRRLVSHLFYEQSSRWDDIINAFIETLGQAIQKCCLSILSTVVVQPLRQNIELTIVKPALDHFHEHLRRYVDSVMSGHRIRVVLQFNTNVGKCIKRGRGRETSQKLISALVEHSHHARDFLNPNIRDSHLRSGALSYDAIEAFSEEFVESLQLDRSDGAEAIECMITLYQEQLQVLLSKFNYDTVHREILTQLSSVFSRKQIKDLSPEQVQTVLGDVSATQLERGELTAKLRTMVAAVAEAKKFHRSQTLGEANWSHAAVPAKRSRESKDGEDDTYQEAW